MTLTANLLCKQQSLDAERTSFFGPLARMQFFDSDGGVVRGDGFERIVQLLLCRVETVNPAFCFCGIRGIGVRGTFGFCRVGIFVIFRERNPEGNRVALVFKFAFVKIMVQDGDFLGAFGNDERNDVGI